MSYLQEQFKLLQNAFPKCKDTGVLRDRYGVHALVIYGPSGKRYFFVAKRNMSNNIVSVNLKLVNQAREGGINIIMAIAGTFYNFTPINILLNKKYVNDWHGERMINFDFRLGAEIQPVIPTIKDTQLDMFHDDKETIQKLIDEFECKEIAHV